MPGTYGGDSNIVHKHYITYHGDDGDVCQPSGFASKSLPLDLKDAVSSVNEEDGKKNRRATPEEPTPTTSRRTLLQRGTSGALVLCETRTKQYTHSV